MVRSQSHRRASGNSETPSAAPTWGAETTLPGSRSSLSLHNVIELCPADNMRVETTVIAVSGYGTPKVHEWGMEAQLAGTSAEFASRLHMYTHESNYNPESNFSWESFLKAGSDLAEDLAQFSKENPRRPIIFIAHSLGGLLLKKALILAHQNVRDPRFQLLVKCLSGILFLGTPHAGEIDKAAQQKKSSRLPDPAVFELAGVAASFQQIAHVPILSVYECPKTKRFGKTKVLVDEKLATISSVAEKLLGVHLAHQQLCKVDMLKDDTYSARDFLRSIFQDLVESEMWNAPGDASTSLVSPTIDPLNPLNLAPIVPTGLDNLSTANASSRESSLSYRGWSVATPPLSRPRRRASLISTNSNRLVDSRKAQLPCINLAHHTPNPDFVGREEAFHLMDRYLLPRDIPESGSIQSTQSFALCGMGGVGKTSLAVEYAFSRVTKFGAVVWIEAGGVSQLATDFARLSTHLGLETVEEAIDLKSSKEIAKEWLNSPKSNGPRADPTSENDSWLLIFDNADNLDIIADYIPFDGNGSVLITSRDPFAKTHFFSTGGGINMEPLSIKQAANLLCKLVTPTGTSASTEEQNSSIEVATWLDGLPLAMSQMAGLIRRRQLSIREFADLYSNDTRYAEIHNVTNPLQQKRYRHTLATVYRFEDFGKEASRLLQVLAFLNPDRVREDIFCKAGTPTLTTKPGYHNWTPTTFEKARYELLTSSAIKRNIEKKELWIHRVIQAEVRARMDEVHRYEVFSEAVHLLAALWPPGDHCSQVTERWNICEDLLPHLERFCQLYVEYSDWEQYEVDQDLPMLMNEAAVSLY